MKKNNGKNRKIPNHREDLAEIIISKSRNIKQDEQVIFVYSFAAKFKYGLPAFLILAIAFFFGANQASSKYYQPLSEQKSVVEEIYYSNFNIL